MPGLPLQSWPPLHSPTFCHSSKAPPLRGLSPPTASHPSACATCGFLPKMTSLFWLASIFLLVSQLNSQGVKHALFCALSMSWLFLNVSTYSLSGPLLFSELAKDSSCAHLSLGPKQRAWQVYTLAFRSYKALDLDLELDLDPRSTTFLHKSPKPQLPHLWKGDNIWLTSDYSLIYSKKMLIDCYYC